MGEVHRVSPKAIGDIFASLIGLTQCRDRIDGGLAEIIRSAGTDERRGSTLVKSSAIFLRRLAASPRDAVARIWCNSLRIAD
jgi:hypothetical protein